MTREHATANAGAAFGSAWGRENAMGRNLVRFAKPGAPIVLALFVVIRSGIALAAPPTPISACGTISSAGNYVLTTNLTASGDCITITANNVNIDLRNHTISGDGSGSGIVGNNNQNIVINDGKILKFDTGIKLTRSSGFLGDNTIQNVTVSNNSNDGILIDGCCNTFAKVTVRDNGGDGLRNNRCCSTVTNVVASGNGGDGMELLDCCYVVEHSNASGNAGDGIFADDCCSAVDDSTASNNQGDGLDLQGCCSVAANDVTNGNSGDGVFFSGCCGDDRGNNIAVNSKSSGNSGHGFEFTDLRNSASNLMATKNGAHGVFMTCPATENAIVANGNGSSNLDEDTSGGVCTDLNNKAP